VSLGSQERIAALDTEGNEVLRLPESSLTDSYHGSLNTKRRKIKSKKGSDMDVNAPALFNQGLSQISAQISTTFSKGQGY